MARYLGSVCRQCRREGMKLFLKGDRCFTDKCAIEKRAYPPGQHGTSFRQKQSEYGTQLREKQKVKRIYGMLEKQFRRLVGEAARRKGTMSWVEVDSNKFTGKVMGDPKREDLTLPIQEQLIVEHYSR
ncbi:MAG: hypothetical protein IIA41_04020 [SAR324 cluster bacterium]|nr:hypothetical protein [SAR324 cluster bacterium]